jgi:hypothetical protein
LQIPSVFGVGYKIVCQGFFLSITNLSKSRVIRVSKILKHGGIPRENRGGDQVSHKLHKSKSEVRTFLKELRGQESHYGRNKSKRIYLNSNLSIAKLYKIYKSASQDQPIKKVSFSTFHRIFSNEFNIGFKSPASDICSLCQRLGNSIKREKDITKKQNFIMEKRIHNLKAKTFYTLMRENIPETKTYCFDMQQVQPLPKTPINDAFYLRQISYYTLCIVGQDSKNPKFYSWTEEQAGRGSTEVASGLLNFLNTEFENADQTITAIRLFCDGCGGQNKNAHTIHALHFWLQNTKSKITTITVIFPVRGHSFLPADRTFGRVEKILKKEPFIKTKEHYHELYNEVGEVKVLGRDWKLYNVKGLENVYKKIPGISGLKKIVLQNQIQKGRSVVMFRRLNHYRFESESETFQNLTKRGRSITNYKLQELTLGRKLPPQKIDNLKSLLKADFNDDWEEDPDLEWYKNLIANNNSMANATNDEVEQTITACECLVEEDPAIHV